MKTVLMLADRPKSPSEKYAAGSVQVLDDALADHFIGTGAARFQSYQQSEERKLRSDSDGSLTGKEQIGNEERTSVSAIVNELTGGIRKLLAAGASISPTIVLGQQHTPVRKTDADTNAAALFSLVIPGGTMGPNDALRINTLWTVPNSATQKKLKVTLGGTEFMNSWQTTIVSLERPVLIRNRNAVNSQVAFNAGQSTGFGNNTGNNAFGAVDMSVDQTLAVVGEWGTAGAGSNVITLESVLVELLIAE